MTDPLHAAVGRAVWIVQAAFTVFALSLVVVSLFGDSYPLAPTSMLMAAAVTQGFVVLVEILFARPLRRGGDGR